ncbi:unnamed protein product [Phytophthora lilii]|uniref:Unnamed protein product n=1 Tax=Phytophthora lilii TaxID=2077276 RepID=A0A9W6YK01_9STRA|nr:unnamed protein product [Phytophthora lilii]
MISPLISDLIASSRLVRRRDRSHPEIGLIPRSVSSMRSITSQSTMDKPPITLLSTTTGCPTVRCDKCNRPVRAQFEPAYCPYHRDRADPQSGWAFISRDEARLLNIMRENGWTEEALRDAIDLHAQETESRPASPTPSISSISDRTGSLRLDEPLDLSELSSSSSGMAVDLPSPGTPTD